MKSSDTALRVGSENILAIAHRVGEEIACQSIRSELKLREKLSRRERRVRVSTSVVEVVTHDELSHP